MYFDHSTSIKSLLISLALLIFVLGIVYFYYKETNTPIPYFSNNDSLNFTKVKVYFIDQKEYNPDPKTGDSTAPNQYVYRQVPINGDLAKEAINELLKGPTEAETKLGYRSCINSGNHLNSLSVSNGVALVDFYLATSIVPSIHNSFNEVWGICGTKSVDSQIEKTLTQFSFIKKVLITVNGEAVQKSIVLPD